MLSDPRFAQIVYTLRVADAHCFAEARSCRATYRPSYHAKGRSIKLGLRVDTGKAARLPTNAVSTKPYPQIVQTYSPIVESNAYVATTTTWVAGPTASDLLNMNATLTEYLTRTDQLTQDDGCYKQPYPTAYKIHATALRPQPDVPSDAVSYQSVFCTQSTNTSASSSTLTTPEEDRMEAPLKIRINYKRKSCDVEDNSICYVEKRPKYGRKNWINAFRLDDVQLQGI